MFVQAPTHPYITGIHSVRNLPPWWLAFYYLLFGSFISYLVTEPLGRAQQTCLLLPVQQLAYLVNILHRLMDHENLLEFYENTRKLRESQCLGWRAAGRWLEEVCPKAQFSDGPSNDPCIPLIPNTTQNRQLGPGVAAHSYGLVMKRLRQEDWDFKASLIAKHPISRNRKTQDKPMTCSGPPKSHTMSVRVFPDETEPVGCVHI